QTELPSAKARSSIHDGSRFLEARSDSSCTTVQVTPPSFVLAIPLNRRPSGPRRPRRPRYAVRPWSADAATGPRVGLDRAAGPQDSDLPAASMARRAPLLSR